MSNLDQDKMNGVEDFDDTPTDQQARWEEELTAAKKEVKDWHDKGEKVWKKYLDVRKEEQRKLNNFNVFPVNVDILRSTLYARLPCPSVSRRFNDANNQPARVASNILQRVLEKELSKDGFDDVAKQLLFDYLVPGAGVAWVRYEAEEGQMPDAPDFMQTDSVDEQTEDIGLYEQQKPPIVDELTPIEYVHWNDFFWSPERTWNEVRWIARRVYMTHDAMVKRFGEEKVSKIPVGDNKDNPNSKVAKYVLPDNQVLKRTEVYEIWDKETKKIYWVVQGADEVMDEKDDFLGLCGFFPTKQPLFSNISTQSLVPKTFYEMIQDQYMELNNVNNRISKLIESMKVVGVYDEGQPAVRDVMQNGFENDLIPVKNWGSFASSGGLSGAIDFVPLDEQPKALIELRQQRADIISHIEQLTGISDLVRGESAQYVTATAEQLKSHYASARMVVMQQAVAKYLEGLVQLKAELICRYYDENRILLRAQAQSFTQADQAMIPAAMQILKNGDFTDFVIEVSVDSIKLPNQQQEQSDALELIDRLTAFFGQALPNLNAAPKSVQMISGEGLRYAVSKFKGAEEFEGVIDAGLQELKQEMANPQPPKPTPDEVKMQADIQHQQAMAQREAQQDQMEMQQKQQELAANMIKADKDRESNEKIAQLNFAAKMKELEIKERELALRERELDQQEMTRVTDFNLRNKELSSRIPADMALPQDAGSLFDMLPINSLSEGLQNQIASERARHLSKADLDSLHGMLNHIGGIINAHKQSLADHASAMNDIANAPIGEAEIEVVKTDKGMKGKIR